MIYSDQSNLREKDLGSESITMGEGRQGELGIAAHVVSAVGR